MEHIPNVEEVSIIFRRLTNKEYKEVRKIEDKKGLYVFDITILGEIEGDIIEYSLINFLASSDALSKSLAAPVVISPNFNFSAQ